MAAATQAAHDRLFPVGSLTQPVRMIFLLLGVLFYFFFKSSSESFTKEGKTTVSFYLKLAFWYFYQPRVFQERFFRVF